MNLRWPRSPLFYLIAAPIVVVSAALGAGWTIGVVSADPDGPFGQSTAAWAQAVGSILAIFAAMWIDQGAARRQQDQLSHADLSKERARVELVMAISTQIDFVLRYADRIHDGLLNRSAEVAPMIQYDMWRSIADDTTDVLTMLMSRLEDPILLMHAASFRRALQDPDRHAEARFAGDHLRLFEWSLGPVKFAGQHLVDYCQAVADRADPSILWPPVPEPPDPTPAYVRPMDSA